MGCFVPLLGFAHSLLNFVSRKVGVFSEITSRPTNGRMGGNALIPRPELIRQLSDRRAPLHHAGANDLEEIHEPASSSISNTRSSSVTFSRERGCS
jgi:hypothetical protein